MKVTVTVPPKLRKAAKESIQRAVGALGAMARDRLTDLAQKRLQSFSQSYINGISTPVVTENTATITLNGQLNNMMEKGTGPFDIKKMLRGRSFVNVPFQHGTPGTSRNPMPKGDYSVMQKLVQSAQNQALVRGPKVMPTTARPGEKVGRTASMVRTGATGHHQYLTFRRISRKSLPTSWIHPGFKALNIFTTVRDELEKVAPKVVADYLKEGLK